MSWPYPGDSPVARARRVAHCYRAALEKVDADGCAQIDDMMRRWQQLWVVPRVVTHDPDDWVSPVDAADLVSVRPAQLRDWRRLGRITGRKRPDGRWEYRVGDVLALSTDKRRRGRKVET